MYKHIFIALLVRHTYEGFRLAKAIREQNEVLKDYFSDIKHLVHILNENDIELDEFDYIVLNTVRRKSRSED